MLPPPFTLRNGNKKRPICSLRWMRNPFFFIALFCLAGYLAIIAFLKKKFIDGDNFTTNHLNTDSVWTHGDMDAYFNLTGRRDRVYCMVPSLYNPKKLKSWTTILSSWGRRCDWIKFFVDPLPDGSQGFIPNEFEANGFKAEVITVPMVRLHNESNRCGDNKPCRHIWEKIWRSWDYVATNDLDKADWFMKIDDDTFFVPSNLRKWLRYVKWLPDDAHYFGNLIHVKKRDLDTFISGVCTGFSREAIRRFSKRVKSIEHEYGSRSSFPNSHGKCVDRDGATEELVTSKCLSEAGVYAEESVHDNKELVLPLGLNLLNIKRNLDSRGWYWNHKPENRGTMMNCCSHEFSFGIHGYKDWKDMERLNYQLYHGSISDLEAQMNSFEPDPSKSKKLDFIIRLRKGIESDPLAFP